jgi:hypothetical protein
MKTKIYTGISILTLLLSTTLNAQEEKDTTRLNLGETEVLLINTKKGKMIVDGEKLDTINAAPDKEDNDDSHEGHWAGLDFGYVTFLNAQNGTEIGSNPYFDNILSNASVVSVNMFDHKFRIYKNYFGITTGIGMSFYNFSIKNNNLLYSSGDSVIVIADTLNNYKENGLNSSYLNIPLLLEFNSKEDNDKSYYMQAGVIGSYNVGSSVLRKIKRDGFRSKERIRGDYAFNDFKLDAALRMGYGNFGVYVNYALMPLFNTKKFEEVYPLTFGISLNF